MMSSMYCRRSVLNSCNWNIPSWKRRTQPDGRAMIINIFVHSAHTSGAMRGVFAAEGNQAARRYVLMRAKINRLNDPLKRSSLDIRAAILQNTGFHIHLEPCIEYSYSRQNYSAWHLRPATSSHQC